MEPGSRSLGFLRLRTKKPEGQPPKGMVNVYSPNELREVFVPSPVAVRGVKDKELETPRGVDRGTRYELVARRFAGFVTDV